MNRALLIVCMVAFQLKVATAQKASLQSVNSSIEARYGVKLDTVDLCDIYILNGIAYDENSINSALSKYSNQQVLYTQIADLSKTTFFNRDCKFVTLLGTESNQTKEDKEKVLTKVRDNLNNNLPELIIRDYLCQECMQVVVDGEPVGAYQAREVVNKLKPQDIKYVAIYDTPNPEVYGRNAVNGLIEIYLKEKKKSR